MELYKRDNSPYWQMSFTVNGERIRKSTNRPLADKSGAQAVMTAEHQRMLNAAQFGHKPDVTLADAWEATIARADGRSKAMYRVSRDKMLGLGSYKGRQDWFTIPGRTTLRQLTQKQLDDLVNHRRRHGYRNNTVIRDGRAMFNYAAKHYAVNPQIDWSDLMTKPFEKSRFLSYDEEAEVITRILRVVAWDGTWERVMSDRVAPETAQKAHDLFVVLIDTGLRLGEALSLRLRDCDFMQGVIEVSPDKTDITITVPMSDRVVEVMRRRGNRKVIFGSLMGPMACAVKYLRRVLHEVCDTDAREVAKRGAATLHSLRDTFASRLVKDGLSLVKVSKLLGHTSVAMTRKYVHLEPKGAADEARELMNRRRMV